MNPARHHRHDRTNRRALGGLVAMALLAAACTDAGTADDTTTGAPPSEPVVLRIATNEGPDTPSGAAVVAFADAVDDLSDGALRVEPAWEAAGAAPDDWDQAVAETVMSGDNQLGYIPARAFDALGVHTLQALQTPFLLTTTERVNTALRSSLANDLMEGLDDIGLTGLQLFPEDLRRIFSYGQPMVHPRDLTGRTIRAPRSDMTAAVLASVGADVADPSGDAWDAAVASGELHGVESSLAWMAGLGPDHAPVVTAGNIALFPKVNVLVVHRETFERLDDGQRALVRQAAADAAGSPGVAVDEGEAADAFCAIGGRIVQASPDDVSALRAAMARSSAPHDASRTQSLARALDQLVGDLPDSEVVTCQHGGTGAGAPSPGSSARPLLTVDTQIGSGAELASPVRTAAPALAGCTHVRDLTAEVDDSDPDVTRFTGTKLVTCAEGELTIAYRARMQTSTPGVTTGTWRITDSTLPTARAGSGELSGDGSRCRTEAEAEACIQDVYVGTVQR